jgi:hypothetical protein
MFCTDIVIKQTSGVIAIPLTEFLVDTMVTTEEKGHSLAMATVCRTFYHDGILYLLDSSCIAAPKIPSPAKLAREGYLKPNS